MKKISKLDDTELPGRKGGRDGTIEGGRGERREREGEGGRD